MAGATSAEAETDPLALASTSADPGPAAEHALAAYDLGLREAGPLAVALGFAAGLRARQLFDRDAATAFLERATAIWRRLPAASAARFDAATAYVNLAELRMAADDEASAQITFRAAIGAARTPEELASVYEHFTFLGYRHGDFAATLALCDEALARLPLDAASARAVITGRIGLILGRLHRLDEGMKYLEESVAALEMGDDRAQLCLALDNLGVFLSFVGRTGEALGAAERALALALDSREARLEIVRAHLAEILKNAGRASEARPHAQRSLEVAEQMGEWYFAAVSAWLAADVEDALGEYEAAVRLRHRELALLGRIGGNRHNEARTHAHLAHLARLMGDPKTEADEAKLARKLACEDPDPAYTALIENALTVERWSEVPEF
jgi:tetratricopeptide (TPR) repeat protein